MFARHIGIDYSGAETANASLKGLRVYLAEGDGNPEEVQPPPSPRKYWTRKGIAEWLVALLDDEIPMLVGIDHGFSFPLRFFEAHQLAPDWGSTSLTISAATGRPTRTIPTLSSCGTGLPGTGRRGWAIPAGDD